MSRPGVIAERKESVSTSGTVLSMLFQGLSLLPGIVALFAVGYAAKLISGYIHIEYILFAIAIGMVISNTVGVPAVLVPGIETYEFWLKVGIVFLGARLALQNVLGIGAKGLVLVVLEILLSIAVAKYLANLFGLSRKLGDLIGIGVGICGVSAIIGATGAIRAEEEDATYAIATILIFGAVMVFLYPLIGDLLGLSDQFFGYWAGLSIDNTAETVATGFAYSQKAGEIATITKLTRNALMGFVILIYALVYARQGLTAEVSNKGAFLWERFPKFLIGFLVFSLLATLGVFSDSEVSTFKHLSKWVFMLAFAGVGFKAQLSRMKAGLKPFLVGLGVESAVAVATFVLVALVL